MKHILYLSVLALALTACADREAEVVEEPIVEEPMVTEPMVAEPVTQDVTVDGTISALEGGITALAPAAALDNIRAWEAQLANIEGTEDVREELAELREALSQPTLDGSRIAEILQELGEETSEVGAGNAGVERLGSLLTQAGQQLASM